MMGAQDEQVWVRLAQTAVPGCRLLAARPLSGGSSAQMVALDIATAAGEQRTLVARRRDPAAESLAEFRLLQALQARDLPAPRPLFFDDAQAILVLDYVPGEITFAPPNVLATARRMGRALAAIHDMPAADPALDFLPRRGPGCPELARDSLPAALPAEAIRAALLAAGPPPARNAPTVLHGDFWPGNVLWQNGRLAAVLDWEDAGRGEPLIDLAISRLDNATIFGLAAAEAFTAAYAAERRIDQTTLPYWDLCAALRLARLVGDDLAGWAAFFAPYGRPDITAGTIRVAYAAFTAAAQRCL